MLSSYVPCVGTTNTITVGSYHLKEKLIVHKLKYLC